MKFNERWEKRIQNIIDGDKDLSCYCITKELPSLILGGNRITPSTLLIFRKTKYGTEMSGLLNGQVWNLPESDDNAIRIIFDRSNRKKLKMLAKHGALQFTYPDKNEADDTEKLILLQKNQYFCEAILYDPAVSKNLLYIPYNNKTSSYAELELFVISYIRTHFPDELKNIKTGELFKWEI